METIIMNHQDIDEKKLILQLQLGQNSAFEKLVECYQSRIYHICLRMLHEQTEAEDITQEVFIRVIKSIGQFRGDCSLNTWLCKIAINLSKNRLLALKKTKGNLLSIHQFEGDYWETQAIQDKELDPLAGIQGEERIALITQALSQLDHDLKSILILREMEGLSYEEISMIQKIPLGTVRSRLHRARIELMNQCQQKIKEENHD
jgi:RNA polymerase sigma-70 factor (ECF subfamily)